MIYLVLNIDDIEEPYVIDICSNKETADNLREIYVQNFINNDGMPKGYAESIIKIEEVDISTDNNVFWTAYPEDLVPNITYNC